MINYFYDCYSVLSKVYTEKTYVKQALADTPIEEKNRSFTVKTCYGVLDKDVELSYYIKYLTEKSPKQAIRVILKIAMYDLKYLQKHDYAITKNAVELTKKLGKSGASGFVNAFLRKFISTEIPLPTDKTEYLSVKYSFPLFLVKAFIADYGEARAESIMSAENIKTCLSFYDSDGEKYLSNLNIEYEKTPFDNVFFAKNFVRNKDYDDGIYTFQALGSVAICNEVFPCEKILDCCAAPGGKSIRLSYKCKTVYAWDVYPHRVELINEYAKRMKRENILSNVCDAKKYEEKFDKFFDAVICDAPCSGTGVINDNPDIKLNRVEEDVNSLVKEQLAILKNVSKYVKVGGYLYYSTCSILKRENIDIVKAFMSDVKGFEIEKINPPIPFEDYNGTASFLPDISGGLGFYVAKFKRIG